MRFREYFFDKNEENEDQDYDKFKKSSEERFQNEYFRKRRSRDERIIK